MTPRLLLVALVSVVPLRAHALDVLVTGSWSETIGAGDLATGAGSDLVGTVSSGAGQIWVDVASTSGASDAWRIDIRRTNAGWASGVRLWGRRTSDGTGPGSVTGGESWQEITVLDTASFSGQGDRTDIGLELQVSGLTVELPSEIRSTTVTYTVVDQ